jgi:hypothetical protein
MTRVEDLAGQQKVPPTDAADHLRPQQIDPVTGHDHSQISARDATPQLRDVPDPAAADGEVVDDVDAASVNGFDLVVAAGYLWDAVPHTFPACPGATSSAPSAPSAQPSTMYRWATASPGYSPPMTRSDTVLPGIVVAQLL